MSLFERIKTEAAKQNTNIASLERIAGLGNGTIRRWDNNVPAVDKLAKIANLLNISIDDLYYDSSTAASPISLSATDIALITNYHKLSSDNQNRCIGYVERLLEEQKPDFVDERIPTKKVAGK